MKTMVAATLIVTVATLWMIGADLQGRIASGRGVSIDYAGMPLLIKVSP